MIPHFKLIAYGVVITIVITAGIYAKVIYNRAQRVDGLEQQITDLRYQIENERSQTENALKREHEIQQKLAAAYAGNADLAARLRRAYTARLPKTSPFAPEPVGTPGTGGGDGEIDAAVTAVIGACKADSLRLQEWQRYFESIDPALK